MTFSLFTFCSLVNPSVTKDAESSEDVVTIDLDTHKLLSEMIHQASRVVAAVVDVANTASIVPESKLCRSSSFLAMPPPKAKNLQPKPNTSGETVGLELLSQAAGGEPCVVSPDMRSKASRSLQVPCLTLVSDAESEAETEPDLASLSPDQCADIVDGIFGEFDEAILEHPSKKHKVDLDLM